MIWYNKIETYLISNKFYVLTFKYIYENNYYITLYKILGKHLEDDIKYFQVKKSPLLTFLIVCVGGVKAKLKDSVPSFH